METLVLAGFALAFMVPLILLFLSTSGNELNKTALSQAKVTARTISDEAGEIYLQGPGAKKTILVNYPSGVLNGSAEGGIIMLSLELDGRQQDVVSTTFANISGNLSGRRTAGLQQIDLQYNDTGNFVSVRYG